MIIFYIYNAATMAATPRPKAPPAILATAAFVDLAAPELLDVDDDFPEDFPVPVEVATVVAAEPPDSRLAPAVMVTGRMLISVGATVVTVPLVIVVRTLASVPVNEAK
jgi:hypothetical protein